MKKEHPPLNTFAGSIKSDDFPEDFTWGVSSSSLQTEGTHKGDGKGPSIWDEFAKKRKKILNGDKPSVACDFYNNYLEDIALMKKMGIRNFRFSISWPRILPEGTGDVNIQGIDFYHKVMDACLAAGIEPWVTLYHWDLPQALHMQGGWTNRKIVDWFSDYVTVCVQAFKGKVKHWMILNEPMVFTGAGYFLGVHAPGKKGLSNLLPAIHHAVLCQAEGARIVRKIQPDAMIGTTYSCSYLTPYRNFRKDKKAVKKMDALLNRLFIEPALGMGYPTETIPFLKKISDYILPGDEKRMQFDFDFIGIQNYTREVVANAFFVPYLRARFIPASKRKVVHTAMNWEIYPEAIYEMIKKFSAYRKVKRIIVTENGASFHDEIEDGEVVDIERINYLGSYMEQLLRAVKKELKVQGYFVWSLTDNFEWAEGYRQRFGLVYVDYKTQKRYIKKSGEWYSAFLGNSQNTRTKKTKVKTKKTPPPHETEEIVPK